MTDSSQNICLVGPTYPYRGGIAHHTTLLCKSLRKNHKVLFVSFSRQYPKLFFGGRSDKDPSSKILSVENVEYILDSLNPWTWYKTSRRITQFRPDQLILPWWVVFWFPQFFTISTLVRRWSGARIVLLCHNVIEHESTWAKILLSRIIMMRADKIVTQSHLEAKRVKTLLGSKAPVTIGFHPTYAPLVGVSPDQKSVKRELGLIGRVILFFGFIREYKGLDVLLQALPAVKKVHCINLLIVGEFWQEKRKYLEKIELLGLDECVHIVDGYARNEEIDYYFAAADLVVLPYRSGTGSGVVQLAYGMKKPVIATTIGNLNEIIEDGVNGRLVPPGDPISLANAIIQSLEEERLNYLTKNAIDTKNLYSWDRLSELLCGDNRI